MAKSKAQVNGRTVSVVSALHLLHRAGQRADEIFAANMGKSDLTPRQFAVLMAAQHTDDMSQTALVDETGIDRSTLADIVRRLVQRGLLQRRRSRQDARMYAVRITPAGREVLKTAMPAAKSADDAVLEPLTAAERKAFIDALVKIVSTLGPIASARVSARRSVAAAMAAPAKRSPVT